MKEQSVIHATYAIRRNYPVPRQRVFAAFSDPAKKRRWFAEGERAAMEEFQMDFRVGGQERTRSRLGENSPFPGALLGNDTTYQDIVPERRIVLAYTMAIGDRRISASLATFEFFPTEEGTELVFTEQAAFFEGADGPQMREAGWRKLLDQLARELAAGHSTAIVSSD